MHARKKAAAVAMAALLAFGASTSYADSTSAMAHISASVTNVLWIAEVSAMNFGNFALTCASSLCDTQSSIVLADNGLRTATSAGADTIALLNGAAVGGITSGTAQETGAQAPGFYSIDAGTEGTGSQNVYITFADAQGNLIDINHPANHVNLSGPVANAFTVDTFTFESDTGTTGYVQQNPSQSDIYGTFIPLVNGKAIIRVGATLHTAAGPTPPPGQYTGTFNIMASY